MSEDVEIIKENLIEIHIIDQGIDLYYEKFSDELELDNVLVTGFISALHGYTFAIEKEEIKSIDFETYKFLFLQLCDEKMLCVVLKGGIEEEMEKKILHELNLRYEIIIEEKDITSVSSIFDEAESKVLPLELIAEIRKRGKKKGFKQDCNTKRDFDAYQPIMDDFDIPSMPSFDVPQIKSEVFSLYELINDDVLEEMNSNKIKNTLSNFFLGYKNVLTSIFALKKEERLLAFAFSRLPEEQVVEIAQYVIEETTLLNMSENIKKFEPKILEFNEEKLWFLPYSNPEIFCNGIFIGTSRDELNSMGPHLKRIMFFLSKLF